MRRALWWVALLWAGVALAEPPRLGVLIVVDQLSSRLLEAQLPQARAGLKRLATGGFQVRELTYQHAPPVTAAGHATLVTGVWSGQHGVPANAWWDATQARVVLPGEDPRYRILGRTPREVDPVAPTHLRTSTLGDALKALRPGAKVVSIAGKDRAALMLGGLSADLALWVDRLQPRFTTSTRYAQSLPAWLEPATRELREGLAPDAQGEAVVEKQLGTGAADVATVTGALAAVRALELGQDAVPDLLLVGFSRFDKVLHQHGPLSAQAQEAFLSVDAQVGRLLEGLDAAVGKERYVVLLTADHGGGFVPEDVSRRGVPAGRIDTRALMARLESVADAVLGPADWFAAFSGATGFYVRAAARGRIHRADAALREAARQVPGVLDLLPGPTLQAGQGGALGTLYAQGYVPGRSPDFLVVPAPYWTFDEKDRAHHASPYLYDRQVPLLLAGPQVRPGVLQTAEVVDVAPTLGRLLGVGPPAAAVGRVLTEALP